MGTWVFHGLAALSLLVFAGGVAGRLRFWLGATAGESEGPRIRLGSALRQGAAVFASSGALRTFALDGLLIRRLWRVSRYRWLVHALLAWSFAGLFVIGSLGDMTASLGVPLGKDDRWFAALNDTLGLALLAGVLLAAARRLFPATPHPTAAFDDGLALAVIGLLALGGFFLEAARYLDDAVPGSIAGYSYAGYAVSRAIKPAGLDPGALHDGLWWTHALLALGLVAYIPYSKLFHMFAAPATVVRNAGPASAPVLAPVAGLAGMLAPAGSEANRRTSLTAGQLLELDACIRCGECMRACSSFQAKGDEGATLVGMIRQRRYLFDGLAPLAGVLPGRSGVTVEQWERFQTGVFSCTLCGRCQEVCPVGIKTRSLAMALRQELATARCMMPRNMGIARDAVVEEGNVFRFPNEDRAMWAEFLDDIPPDLMGKDHADVLYFVGCVSSFSPAVQEIPQAFLQVLLKAGMDVALLAGKERCCGFPLIMGGLGGDARALIEHNMAELRRLGSKTVVFNCPSCYYTWKKYYPAEAGGVRLAHSTEIINELVQSGRLVFESGSLPVTYHDPCDLGRGLGVYDVPRDVLKRFASADYIELSPSREAAMCCGGGGDVEMWDPELVSDVNNLLTDAVVKSGAGILVQGCPQCKRVTQRGLESRGSDIQALDIAELALEFGTFVDPTPAIGAVQEREPAWHR